MAAPFYSPATSNYFGPTAASISLPSSAGADFSNPTASYNTAYQNASNINQQIHQNVQGGYAQMLGQFQNAQQGLQAGYRGLETRVLRRLRGSNRANIQDIADKYKWESGLASHQMIDRGLGNLTVQQSVQRGLLQDATKETTRSQGQYAQMMANAQMGIGGNALSAMGLGIAGASAIQQGAINAMERVSAPYPDPGLWASLASQLAAGRIPMGGLPGMPGPSRPNGPTGGYGPQGGAFYQTGGDNTMGTAYGGYNMLAGGGMGGGGSGYSDAGYYGSPESSAYARGAYGELIGNQQVGSQVAADYSGYTPFTQTMADYSSYYGG